MRILTGLIGLSLLAACATPQQRCVNRETRDYRITYKRVTTLEQDLARGYSLEEEDVTRTRWVRCGGAKGERPRLCLDEYDVTVTRRVPVDAEVARAELGVLKARLVKQRAPMDAAVAQCRIAFPEEKEG